MTQFAPGANNFAKFVLSDECSVPWYIYVETFFPAFLKLLITQNVPLWDDLARARASALSWGGKPVTQWTGHNKRAVIEADNNARYERYSQRGLKTLLVVTAPLEKIGLLWLLYSTADQFYFDWQTLIELYSGCAPGQDFGHYSRTDPQSSTVIEPFGQGFTFATLTQDSLGASGSPGAVTLPPGNFQVFVTLKVTRLLSDIDGVAVGVNVSSFGGDEDRIGDREDLKVGRTYDLIYAGELTVLPFTTATVSWRVYGPSSPTGVVILSGRLFVARQGLV